jgi:hypothetical protein
MMAATEQKEAEERAKQPRVHFKVGDKYTAEMTKEEYDRWERSNNREVKTDHFGKSYIMVPGREPVTGMAPSFNR